MASLTDAPRIPPQNLEAEQAVLGSILADNKNLEKVSEFLKPEHFAHPIHGKIYDICSNYINQNRLADIVTLRPLFANDEALKDVGGVDYLAKLASSASTIINVVAYGREILDCYIRRQLISVGTDIVNKAFDRNVEEDAVEQLEVAEKSLFEVANERELTGGLRELSSALDESIHMVEKAKNNPNGI